MAGIGQRNTFDHPASWNSAAQLGMGRTVQNDSQKSLMPFQTGVEKRSLSNAGGASALSGLSGGGISYAPRPASSTRSKGILSSGVNLRNNYCPESSLDNVSMNFIPYGNSPGFMTPLQRGPSESSLLAGFANHSINPDISTIMSGFGNGSKSSLIGMGGGPSKSLGGGLMANSGNSASSNSLNQGVSSPGLTFDPSDFPPIMNSINSSQSQAYSGNLQHRNYVSAMSKSGGGGSAVIPPSLAVGIPSQNSFSGTTIQASPEFSIDQDFPALPVAPTTSGSSVNPTTPSVMQSALSLTASSGATLQNQESHRLHQSHSGVAGAGIVPSYAEATTGSSLELLEDHYVGNIPKNMICDQYGMIGLLKLIQIDSTFETLAPGVNLASMGIINWPPPGDLHLSLASPLSDACILRPQDMDFNVPPEYLVRHLLGNRLPADPSFDLLTDEILFWLFYNCCREEAQLVAAYELYKREWRYHKKKQLWITRIPNNEPLQESNHEQGAYHCWDPMNAEKVVQTMTIYYADLDDSPSSYRPSSLTLNATLSPLNSGQPQQQQQPPSALPPQQAAQLFHQHSQSSQQILNNVNFSSAVAAAGRLMSGAGAVRQNATGSALATNKQPAAAAATSNGPHESSAPANTTNANNTLSTSAS